METQNDRIIVCIMLYLFAKRSEICLSCMPLDEDCYGDSYFQNLNLPIRTILHVMFLWAADVPVRIVPNLLPVDATSVTQWYQYVRAICSHQLILIHEGGYRIGGQGIIVQVDESLLVKRKYHHGRAIPEKWIFGMYDTSMNCGIAVYVENRTREVLLSEIQKYVAPNTTIWSDEWKAYQAIASLPEHYMHGTVNHSQNFRNPETGVCTNSVEGYWSRLKKFLRRKQVMSATEHLPSYLDEFMWRENYCSKRVLATMNFLIDHSANWDEYGFE